jgi:hypothetical protein
MPVISLECECSLDNENDASKETGGGVFVSSDDELNMKEWILVPAATIRRFVEAIRSGELLLCQG